jgi:hypothetical protein
MKEKKSTPKNKARVRVLFCTDLIGFHVTISRHIKMQKLPTGCTDTSWGEQKHVLTLTEITNY